MKDKVVKGPWLPEEDQLLRDLIKQGSIKKWSEIASQIPGRAGKQCREVRLALTSAFLRAWTAHTHACTRTHTHAHVHMHTYTYTRTCTRTHTHYTYT